MLESISCPSCSTHYGLRRERVRPGLRRAKCFQCAEFFDIENAVAHLIGSAPEPIAEPVHEYSDELTLEPQVETFAPVIEAEPSPVFDELDFSILAPLEPEPLAPVPEPTFESTEDAALSLSDLEGTEDEILDKTLLIDPSSLLAQPTAPAAPAEEEGPVGASGFSSAKDAIAKLLGEAPVAAHAERRTQARGSMDVEATLDALEQTLGGTIMPPPAEAPLALPPAPEPATGSTVRLSTAELQAAMAAGAPKPAHQAPTMAIPMAPPPPALAPTIAIPAPSADSNLLKIQLGQETQENVTLEQMVAWIEHGRVQDYHMVARQHSDNWIEAGKVPSLRPAFDRMRRMSPSASREPLPPPPEATPVKRGGLFGWMGGRG